jgi:hypothetical protein
MIKFPLSDIYYKIMCLLAWAADVNNSPHNKRICLETIDYWIDLFDGDYIVGAENQIGEVKNLMEKTKTIVQSHLDFV